MKRETLLQIFSALVAEADEEVLREVEGLVFWRKREHLAERVEQYEPGLIIEYLAKDGQTRKRGVIDHLNKYSVTVKEPHETQGFLPTVVPIQRVLGLAISSL